MASLSIEAVQQYYDSKTESILRRYGPGPRVHYHNGIMDSPPPATATCAERQRTLIRSQECLLEFAAEFWDANVNFRGTLLDVGCGLGGGAIYWAEHFGAAVTAVTNVQRHATLIAGFAKQAGVSERVTPLVCDATQIPGNELYDAAVALDSMCHMPRALVFDRLHRVMKAGATLGISDFFFEEPVFGAGFDAHWAAQAGTITEHLDLAKRHGFDHLGTEDLTSRAGHFWTTTLALMATDTTDSADAATQRSRQAHELVREGYRVGGLRYGLLRFRKRI